MLKLIKANMKYIVGALVGAFLTVAAMTQTTVDDTIGQYLSQNTGIVVTVTTNETVSPTVVE